MNERPHAWTELAVALARGEALDASMTALRDVLRADAAAARDLEAAAALVRRLCALRAQAPMRAAAPCLDDNALAEYVDGALRGLARRAAERHLAQCDGCLHQALELHRLVAELAPREPVFAYAMRWAARGLAWLQQPAEGFQAWTMQPVPVLDAGVDPPAPAQCWRQIAGAAAAEFALRPLAECSAALEVAVTLRGAPAAGQASLYDAAGIAQSEPLDAAGRLALDALAPGCYTLRIDLAGEGPIVFELELAAA